ncbi:hypothetical protein [Burkholderia contaminans]|uniref:hypothetical protein n=1 Tax=Burkholderia contaminans TaxID=488447 RepID=UPI000B18CE8B
MRLKHRFHIAQNLFRHRKVRDKRFAKNTVQLFSLFFVATFVIAKHLLGSARGESVAHIKNPRDCPRILDNINSTATKLLCHSERFKLTRQQGRRRIC